MVPPLSTTTPESITAEHPATTGNTGTSTHSVQVIFQKKRTASPKRKKVILFFIFKKKRAHFFHFQGAHFFILLLR